MSTLTKIFYALLSISLINYTFNTVFKFLSVPNSSFQSYINWLDALILFFAFLPSIKNTVF